jgi:hypothetical protein
MATKYQENVGPFDSLTPPRIDVAEFNDCLERSKEMTR